MSAEDGWRLAANDAGLALWTAADTEVPVHRVGRSVVVGDLFPRSDRDASASKPIGESHGGDVRAFARTLLRTSWGPYVALCPGGEGAPPAVFREPAGMLDAMTWSRGDGVAVVASDMTRAPRWLWPCRASLNWDRIARFLAAPTVETTAPLFDTIEVVGPGELLDLGPVRRRTAVWTPAQFANPTGVPLPEIQAELVRQVDRCTAALVGAYDRVIVEVSGGLDSSILAGALGATGAAAHVGTWLNYRDTRPEADERFYARAVTDRLGVSLTSVVKSRAALVAADFEELAGSFWPAIGGSDPGRDRDEVARLRATGARAMLSGQGGDGVFFQFPTALIAADAVRQRGWGALASPLTADVARRTRQSVWSVLGQVWAARRGAERRPPVLSSLLSAAARDFAGRPEHAWVQAARAEGLPPAKQLHIQGIAVAHLHRGPSRRLREADLLLPLLAQPVLELCLGIPVPDLAGASFDRPFARAAFAERLPPEVLDRRAKGNQSVFYARLVANSLETLRPWLLDGRLCDAGLLDRDLLDRTLTPESLIWGAGGHPMDVLNAAAVEAWVRHWQGRAPDSAQAGRYEILAA
jgi:asparagine synthase (glutamine-hydrolysing)